MTDTDIIKALECCAGSEILCKDCIYRNSPPYPACKSAAARQALDLINRQKAEKTELEIELKAMRGAANSYKVECERLRNESDELAEQLHNLLIEKDDLFDETERLIKTTL